MTTPAHRRLARVLRPAVVSCPAAPPGGRPAPASAQPAVQGQWSPVFDTAERHDPCECPARTVRCSSGRAARRGRPQPARLHASDLGPARDGPHVHARPPKPGYNLFCSGHAFLPDGRLFVAGGHREQTSTVSRMRRSTTLRRTPGLACRYDAAAAGIRRSSRCPTGASSSRSGPTRDGNPNNTQQVWKDGQWRNHRQLQRPPLYPRMHVVSDGRVFMSGPLPLTQFLDTSGAGNWTPFSDPGSTSARTEGVRPLGVVRRRQDRLHRRRRETAPTNDVEILDLNATPPDWKKHRRMHFARRQHNATLLPDGTVLVMGGTQGTGGPKNGFNDLTPGQPIHSAELWDPKTGHWTTMAKAAVDRCYHSTAVLLPDATVLSAGGGEFNPTVTPGQENDPKDTHKDAQIFSPPYLFRANGAPADRPDITTAPAEVTYGDTFTVGTPHPDDVGQVNWVRLSSVTHSFNTNQRINFLKFTADAAALKVTAPANAKLCPPGHYMLFVLNKDDVPSVAKTIRSIEADRETTHPASAATSRTGRHSPGRDEPLTKEKEHATRLGCLQRALPSCALLTLALWAEPAGAQVREVVVGITTTCPYETRSGCWSGAYWALMRSRVSSRLTRRRTATPARRGFT